MSESHPRPPRPLGPRPLAMSCPSACHHLFWGIRVQRRDFEKSRERKEITQRSCCLTVRTKSPALPPHALDIVAHACPRVLGARPSSRPDSLAARCPKPGQTPPLLCPRPSRHVAFCSASRCVSRSDLAQGARELPVPSGVTDSTHGHHLSAFPPHGLLPSSLSSRGNTLRPCPTSSIGSRDDDEARFTAGARCNERGVARAPKRRPATRFRGPALHGRRPVAQREI